MNRPCACGCGATVTRDQRAQYADGLCKARARARRRRVSRLTAVEMRAVDLPRMYPATKRVFKALLAVGGMGATTRAPGSPLVDNVADDALRWARAMEMATAAYRLSQESIRAYVDGFGEHWEDHFSASDAEFDYYRPSNWRESIERFHTAGIAGDLADIVTSVMGRHQIPNTSIWKYFCGYCWRVIRERQEHARALIDSGEIE